MDFRDTMSIVAQLTALIGMFVAPWLAVKLSLKQFRSTRWWEKKAEACSNIMEHLKTLQYTLGRWYDENCQVTSLSKSEHDTLNKEFGEAKKTIERAAAAGAYLISNDASNTLTLLIGELNKTDSRGDWLADLDRHYSAVKQCIAGITRFAYKDLGFGD